MKKLLAILLAMAMIASLSAVAFAAEIGPITDDDDPTPSPIKWGSIVWVDDGEGYLTESDEYENPGTDFYVPVLYDKKWTSSISMADLSYYKLSYKIVKGSNVVKSVSIVERPTFEGFDRESGLIKIATISNLVTGVQDVTVDLTLTPKKTPGSSGLTKISGRFTAKLAYNKVHVENEGWITDFDDEGTFELDFGYHDVGEDGNEDIEINFGEGQAYFLSTVRLPRNVVVDFNTDIIDDIEDEYGDDANLDYLCLKSGSFRQSGDLYIPADDDDYLYEVVNGKLVKCAAKYDDDEECFVLKGIKKLGVYVICDKKLEVAGAADGEDVEVENPETGVGNIVGIAAALAVVSLVAAGAASLKK